MEPALSPKEVVATRPPRGALSGPPWLDGVAVAALGAGSGLLVARAPSTLTGNALSAVQAILFVAWGWSAWHVARRRTGWERRAWLLFAACVPLALLGAAAAWALGGDVTAAQDAGDPTTSALTLVLYAVLFAGLLALNVGQAPSRDGWRRGLDAAIIAGALFFILWSALYRDRFGASDLPFADRLGTVAVPVFDAALLALATLALAVPDPTRPRGYQHLLAALAVLFAGDVVGTALKLSGSTWVNPIATATAASSLALLWLSSLLVGRQPAWQPVPQRSERAWVRLLPALAVAPAMGSAIVTMVEHGGLSRIEFWTAFTVIGLVLVQLVLTVLRAERLEAGLRSESDFKTQLLRFISHEVANPISPLRVQVSLLSKDPPPGQQRAWDIVHRSIERLLALSKDVREMALAETQRLVTRVERVDLGDQAATAAQAAVPLAQQRGLELVMHIPLEPLMVRADVQRLGQILDNLLSNALKFTRAPGKITVRVEQAGPVARVQVTDTGIGLSAADRDGLFQPFRRAQDGAAPGLGLGLYLCKAIVTELHGLIGVESPGRGQGATFWVSLPLDGSDPDPLPLGATVAAPPVVEPAPMATVKLA